MPNVAVRRRRRAPAIGLRSVGRHQQRAQAAEAVGGDEAERHQFGQRLLDLGAQQAGAVDQLVEERGAVLRECDREPACARWLGLDAVVLDRQRAPTARRGGARSSVIGVVRTGAAPALAAVRPRRCAAAAAPRRHARRGSDRRARPARSRRAAPAGSRSPRRRPAPRSLRAGRPPRRARPALPSARRRSTRCQPSRKRRKSRAATGSISARSRLTV